MIIESTESLRERMSVSLEKSGYQVQCFGVSVDALEELQLSDKNSYSVILSSYMMPKMKGDEILKRAKSMSPESQRLLIADAHDIEIMVSSINAAGIHACLTLPFEDKELLEKVEQCCNQFDRNKQQKNLTRLTQRQNKQLFQIAGNFKKKEAAYNKQIEEKKKEIRLLKSRIRSAGGSIEPSVPVTVKDLIAKSRTKKTPEDFVKKFIEIKDNVLKLLETAASKHFMTINPISYDRVITESLLKKEPDDMAGKILPLLLAQIEKGGISGTKTHQGVKEVVLDEQFEVTVTDQDTKALIKIKTLDGHKLNITHIKQFLEMRGIINGLKSDHEIEQWLFRSTPDDDPFVIAQGRPAKPSKDAQIRYHFKTDFLHAGKINDDGSINFQDRGEIPFVEEEAFLAAKIPAEKGHPGIDVFGREIPVEEPKDLTFCAGPGTRMSEDGIRIYAATGGQPHLDAMGNLSVCPEFQIKGDLGFETGDVDFEGNVIVNGAVKQGFKVKCASLTAKEIQGAEIDIEGDLNVSNGIVDTELVKVKGSVQAKFVHNSKINSFGDLMITKEIIDSEIYLSGACLNPHGIILNSKISAQQGIDAAVIGNKSAKPSVLTVGVDEHTNILVAKLDSKLNTNNSTINEIKEELAALEKEDQELHGTISQHAYVQDRAQLELKDIEKKMEGLRASGNMSAYQKVSKTVKEIRKNAKIAEKKINDGFDRQDEIAIEISQKQKRIKEFEEINNQLLDEKKRLREFSDRTPPLPEVKVGKSIEAGTKVFSANASLNIFKTTNRCRIREYTRTPDGVTGGIAFYELKVGEY